MAEDRWSEVDRYVEGHLVPRDDGLEAALQASAAAGLPAIQVSPAQGKLLHLVVASLGARRALEIGTLGGYSAIWIARALAPDGRLVSLEADPRHAEIARKNLARAGLDRVVEIRVGPALETLPRLENERAGPFDLVFVDADKPNTREYYEWAVRLSHPGSVIIVDNVVRQGALADPHDPDPNVQGMRRFVDRLGQDPRTQGTVLQTVGAKGYDGFAYIRVLTPTASVSSR